MRRPGQHRRWFQLLAVIVKPFLYAFTRRDWRGLENVPQQGGVIIVANHVTVVDPFTLAHAMYDGARRIPRFLAKSEIFKVPVVGPLLRRAGQIAVYRRSREAANSLRDAEAALAAGELVIIYPEGTCTRDPDGWPMVSKTGVARLALACDAPVVPVAHWGAHRVLGYRSKRPHPFPPKLVQAIAGPPVDLSKYRDLEPTNDVLREVTDLLMTQVKELLGELRGETPPDGFYVPSSGTTTASAPLSPDAAPRGDADAAETGAA
ncbi:MAG TPA: lysophospholipid acyltransferase family protein [Acidothermaceae bacterium]|nr:lysophospholipid acyltransferase family protein [Acidothermaceae bacterium]